MNLFMEVKGFEPLVRCRTAVFKTAALDHSATPPVSGELYFVFAVPTCPFGWRGGDGRRCTPSRARGELRSFTGLEQLVHLLLELRDSLVSDRQLVSISVAVHGRPIVTDGTRRGAPLTSS